ncbi:hypothetical protein BC351_01295 [Paenibacillus ferrarius]|uniref:Uncharacterized protein n=1 Tax=Paenibacillus ferrarius TaxID=1469647 RepID=A0A1V4HTK2_9BACL|nr:hypothetical protein [Paenibacillus ferrarius]OPH61905.1 hypothetical protein BC351_01295 [Paenibacillus ferrarius]
MAFRTEEIITYKSIVICDDCKKETELCESAYPIGFDNRMNRALAAGYTFKDTGKQFKNYCKDCRTTRE